MPARILYLCPDYQPPSGGIRKLYRHVDILNQHGFHAVLVHQQPGFRCQWFPNSTRVDYATNLHYHPSDILVIPEIYGPHIATIAPGTRKIVFNQNCYLTFAGLDLNRLDQAMPYRHPDVIATLTVSEDSAAYLEYAFPGISVTRIHYGVNTALFHDGNQKRPLIAFMPRKNAGDLLQVLGILASRKCLDGFSLVPIEGLNETDVAQVLRHSSIFLSCGHPEGFGLPAAEAMACGCAVIGYDGFGGREFLRPEFGWPVAVGDIPHFARTVESVIQQLRVEPESTWSRTRTAAKFISSTYTLQREELDVVSFWQNVAIV